MRRDAWVVVTGGLASAAACECLLYAYPIWGGIPAAHDPIGNALVSVAVASFVMIAASLVRRWPDEGRRRTVVRAALAVVATMTLIGSGLFAYYARRWERTHVICKPALIAPTRGEREAARKKGFDSPFSFIPPHQSCVMLEHERVALEREGKCPGVVMDEAPCRCGDYEWTGKGSANRCQRDSLTTCELRGQTGEAFYLNLGCPGPNNQIVRDARRMSGVKDR